MYMDSEHRYAGLEDNKMHELYYKRETQLGNDKFHGTEGLHFGEMTGAIGVTGSGPDNI